LAESPAFARVDSDFFVVRQGSAYIYLRVLPWNPDRAVVRLVAQVVGGVDMTPDLAIRLLRLNTRVRFGSFGFVLDGACVVLSHTLLGGETLDGEELVSALRAMAIVADEFDDEIVAEAGGKRMQDLVDESHAAALLAALAPASSKGARRRERDDDSSP
jgi:hypothetical protein